MNDLFWIQNVTEPTRVRERREPSMLDYIFADEDNLIDQIHFKPPLGKSDHAVLQWELLLNVSLNNVTKRELNYWKGNYIAMNTAINAVNWQEVFQDKSVPVLSHCLAKRSTIVPIGGLRDHSSLRVV